MTTIDIHPHMISADTVRHPLMPLGGTQSNWSRDRPTPFERLLEAMDAAGIGKAAAAYGHDNSYLAEAIAGLSDPLHRRLLGRRIGVGRGGAKTAQTPHSQRLKDP